MAPTPEQTEKLATSDTGSDTAHAQVDPASEGDNARIVDADGNPLTVETDRAQDAREAPANPEDIRLNPTSDHPTDGTTHPPDTPAVAEVLNDLDEPDYYDPDDPNAVAVPPPISPSSTKEQRQARLGWEEGVNAGITAGANEFAERYADARARGNDLRIIEVDADGNEVTPDADGNITAEATYEDEPPDAERY